MCDVADGDKIPLCLPCFTGNTINDIIQGQIINNTRIYHECEGRIEKSVQRMAIWHHKACRVMTIERMIPRDGFFYPTLT